MAQKSRMLFVKGVKPLYDFPFLIERCLNIIYSVRFMNFSHICVMYLFCIIPMDRRIRRIYLTYEMR